MFKIHYTVINMNKIQNFDYDLIGCFKTPNLNYTVSCDDEVFNKRFHRSDYDMNIMIGTEQELTILYDKMVDFLSNVDNILGFEPDVMFCGLFLNGNDSLLFASDGTYEFEMNLLSQIGVPNNDYIRKSHCYGEHIKKEYPNIYSRIKDFFIN